MSQKPISEGVSTGAGDIHVSCGLHFYLLPLAGWTVARIRRELTERINIPPAATPVVEGEAVGESTVLTPGQSLAFVRPAGEMG